MDRFIHVGCVGKTHGIRGGFYISGRDHPLPKVRHLWVGDDSSRLKKASVISLKHAGPKTVVTLDLWSAPEQVCAHQLLWVDRGELPLDHSSEYLWADMVGTPVFLPGEKTPFAVIAAIDNFGASDVVRLIRTADQFEVLYPLIREFFDLQAFIPKTSLYCLVAPSEDLWEAP